MNEYYEKIEEVLSWSDVNCLEFLEFWEEERTSDTLQEQVRKMKLAKAEGHAPTIRKVKAIGWMPEERYLLTCDEYYIWVSSIFDLPCETDLELDGWPPGSIFYDYGETCEKCHNTRQVPCPKINGEGCIGYRCEIKKAGKCRMDVKGLVWLIPCDCVGDENDAGDKVGGE